MLCHLRLKGNVSRGSSIATRDRISRIRLTFVRWSVITNTDYITQQQRDLGLRLKFSQHHPLEASLVEKKIPNKRHVEAQLRAREVGVSSLSGRDIPHHITF